MINKVFTMSTVEARIVMHARIIITFGVRFFNEIDVLE